MKSDCKKWAGVFLLFGLCCLSIPGIAKESNKQREKVRNLEEQLKRVRESLHEAHSELGRKTDRISQLEEQVEQLRSNRSKVRTDPSTKKQLAESIRKIRDLEKKLEVRKPTAAKKEVSPPAKEKKSAEAAKPSSKPKPSSKSVTIPYAEKSAVNLEGREKVFLFVTRCLKENEKIRFRVEAGADDSEYETVNDVIAENRATFLIDFLKIKGIDPVSIAEISAGSTQGAKGIRKYVRISTLVE